MDLFGFINANKTVVTLATYYVGSAAVGALPPPKAESTEFYQWFYKFSNTLAANATALRGKAAFETPSPPPPAPPASGTLGLTAPPNPPVTSEVPLAPQTPPEAHPAPKNATVAGAEPAK
jgi:hypothetical protein